MPVIAQGSVECRLLGTSARMSAGSTTPEAMEGEAVLRAAQKLGIDRSTARADEMPASADTSSSAFGVASGLEARGSD